MLTMETDDQESQRSGVSVVHVAPPELPLALRLPLLEERLAAARRVA